MYYFSSLLNIFLITIREFLCETRQGKGFAIGYSNQCSTAVILIVGVLQY